MRRAAVALALLLGAPAFVALPPPPARAAAARRVLVDDFENPALWQAQPADGVELALGADRGVHGRALRLDVRFTRGSGYAVAHRAVSLDLPPNYRFSFAVKGDIPPEDLEFKLIDSTGANVWWMNRRMFVYPARWDSLLTRKRQIEFAWGPAGGGEIRHVAALEFAITAGKGGQGTVWLDDLTLEPLPPSDAPPPPVARRVTRDGLVLDFGADRELSGIALDWPPGPPGRPAAAPLLFAVERSDDGARWAPVREARRAPGGHNEIHLPETATRFVRLRPLAPDDAARAALRGVAVTVHPWDWAPSANAFFAQLARGAPRGAYPRAFLGEQPYWTVLGDDPGEDEALIDEDGRLEPWKGGPSLEPFLALDGESLATWSAGTESRSTDGAALPIATVRRTDARGRELSVAAFVAGADTAATLYATYQVSAGPDSLHGALVLALRPFQVNPPAQFLNTPGGACTVRRIARAGASVRVDDRPPLRLVTAPSWFATGAFDEGDPVERLLAGAGATTAALDGRDTVDDPAGRASALLSYALRLGPREHGIVQLAVPLRSGQARAVDARAALAEADERWQPEPGGPVLELPDASGPFATLLTRQLSWARITKDGPALKPGARSYDRSWIRDGALMAEAFLRLGQPRAAKEFAAWYAGYVGPDGAVPCVVDARGPDPTPEHDSHGEFIFLVAEIVRYTGDLSLAERLWPAVRRAALHIDALRAQRRTPEWSTPENAPFFGLLPPSISHEGYSAKPMHSYWDDLWALRGLRDAADLARRLDRGDDARLFAASRDSFAADLARSIRAAMAAHGVDYVPGCADLGDFDATSTTVALDPVEARDVLPPGALERTFERYWRFFLARRDSGAAWDAYTPYELRTVGAMARLGWRERAVEALEWFADGPGPRGFGTWAEVVDHDPRHARFVGDMPHAWVGTDGVRSMLDLLAYTGPDSALVVAAGVPWSWLSDPRQRVRVFRLPTPFGRLDYDLAAAGGGASITLEKGLRVPPGGVRVRPPAPPGRAFSRANVDGRPAALAPDGSVTVRRLPATVNFLP